MRHVLLLCSTIEATRLSIAKSSMNTSAIRPASLRLLFFVLTFSQECVVIQSVAPHVKYRPPTTIKDLLNDPRPVQFVAKTDLSQVEPFLIDPLTAKG
jgi:hypothetical protein